MNEKGELVTKTAQYQIGPVPELTMDLDNVVNREDLQLQTVGHHWPFDDPLPKDVRGNMDVSVYVSRAIRICLMEG